MKRRTFLRVSIASPLAMTTAIASPSAVVSAVVPPSTPPKNSSSTDHSLLLKCISEVESRNNDEAISHSRGRVHARGRYQITSAVWFQHTNRPWVQAHSFFVSSEIARRHLSWLDSNIPRIDVDEVEARPFALAWAWRGGLDGWLQRETLSGYTNPQRSHNHDYARRVYNLYADYRSKQIPSKKLLLSVI